MAKRPKKENRGGARENAGRKSIYTGKERERHVSGYLTPFGWKCLEFIKKRLTERHKFKVTESDATEDAIQARAKQMGMTE